MFPWDSFETVPGTPLRGLTLWKGRHAVNHPVLRSAGHLTSPRKRWTGNQCLSRRACSGSANEHYYYYYYYCYYYYYYYCSYLLLGY